jgi:predicted GNAT superfamily acetyltransferase
VPSEVPYGVGGELSGVTALQDQLRTEFTKWFGKGYVATALVPGAEPAYLLVRGRDGF